MNITAIRNEQNPQPLIQLKNINVVFAQKTALQNIILNIYPNSIITIVGQAYNSSFLKSDKTNKNAEQMTTEGPAAVS